MKSMDHCTYTDEQGAEQMELVKVRNKAQITLPAKIRKALDINEGDYLEVGIQDSKVVLTPQVVIDKFESVELSKQGEQMLDEALDDVKQGKTKEFEDVEDLISDLKQ